MANFYITKEMIKSDKAVITGDEARHISKVLRMKKGERVTLCDGEGMFYSAVLSNFSKECVFADIEKSFSAPTEPKTQFILYQGVPKSGKMELIIQKLTELGAVKIVPVNTARAVGKMEKESKTDRLRKVAVEAAKQSKRGTVPHIGEVMDFKIAAAEAAKADIALIPYEEETQLSLKKAISNKKALTVSVMIGPEGGFEKSEVEYAASLGIIPLTLGKRILRTETAAIALCSAIMYEMDEMQ